MTVKYGLSLVMGILKDTEAIPGLPPASSLEKGETFPVTILDASDHQMAPGLPAIIQGFMSRSEPVIINNFPKGTFSSWAIEGKYAVIPSEEVSKRQTISAVPYYCPRALGGFGQWIRKHVQRAVIVMVRLAGEYESGSAHIDGFTYNIYHLAQGRQRVWICPRQYNHLLPIRSGKNIVYISGSDDVIYGDLKHPKWIQSVPGVWECELEAGDVLIFNNAACFRKFESVTENTEAFSLRVFNDDISPLLAKFHVFNWQQARFCAKIHVLIFLRKIIVASPVKVDGHPNKDM